MRNDSVFKYIFVFLTIVVLGLMGGAATLVGLAPQEPSGGGKTFAIFIIIGITLFIIMLMSFIAILVYKDAKNKGLDPWMWATIAVFVPNLIGVIIYLVVRYNYKKVCIKCGKGFQGEYRICPYCGESQEMLCEGCQTPVMSNWKHCPNCGKELNKL